MRSLLLILTLAVPGAALPALAQTQAAESAPQIDAAKGEFVVPRTTWRMRSVIGNERLLRWRLGLNGNAFGPVTLVEAAGKTDALSLNALEGSDSLKASPEIQKSLDPRLTAEECAAVKGALRTVRMSTYRVGRILPAETTRRRLFEFAKAMGVDTIVTPFDSASVVAELDKFANEFSIKVALHSGKPEELMKALQGRSERIGAAADLGLWLEQGVKPLDGLAVIKDRLLYVSVRDRSALGASGRDVLPGSGVGELKAFFVEVSKLGQRPLIVMLDTTGLSTAYPEVAKSVEALELVVQPGLGAFVTARSREFPTRGLQNLPADQRAKIEAGTNRFLVAHPMLNEMNVNLPADVRQQIEAAVPAKAVVTPKKKRKLLVIDACVANMSHNTIPHGNLMIEMMAKKTGAFEAEFSNDFNQLKYPAIKQYDAIFLNNTVGELFPDPEVREGLLRFVREGGGLGGLHGATYASRSWREGIPELLCAQDCPHRIELGTLKLDDPGNPILQSFGGKDLEHREEYYRFPHEGETAVFSRDKVRVLLTVEFPPPAADGRRMYERPDNDYAVSWVRSYGKGRTFNCSLGHMPETFMSPQIVGHLLGAMQFLVGDLDVDTTPKPKQLTATKP